MNRVFCLIDARKEISTDPAAWSQLPRGQNCKAGQESGEAYRSELLGEQVGKSM